MRRVRLIVWGLALGSILGVGCRSVPPDRYGVDHVRILGTEQMSEAALRGCLGTGARPRAGFTLGVFSPGACGEPPFDVDPPRLDLWAWPWTDWPLLDTVVLEQDSSRIERWYQARGFHQARVLRTTVEPEQAAQSDELPPDDPEPGCEREGSEEGCLVEVTFEVEEGEPTLVEAVEVSGLETLDASLATRVREAITLRAGQRFDEAAYDLSKRAMVEALGASGYAMADVSGLARIDRPRRRADVRFEARPGPVCVFGEVRVEGNEDMPAAPIAAAVLIEPGSRYDFDEIIDAQRAIYGLGSFAAVLVEPILPAEGNVVDIRVDVTPARRSRLGLGAGVQGGELQRENLSESVPQWDIHLLARYVHNNLFGGLRQLTLEERPQMIFQQQFPAPDTPRFGNTATAELRQPGFPEPRTQLVLGAGHTIGPDPYDTFFRHRIDSRVGLERAFLGGRLLATASIRNSIYVVPAGELTAAGDQPPSDSMLTYLEQSVALDLRDDVWRPHAGAFFQVQIHEAGYFLPSSWDYIRLLPDARVYLPLPGRITVAARFALGLYFIHAADETLDTLSQQLGPRDFRLRGGGASSNRGYLPGRLGDGVEGGTRRWEASLELRVPITPDLGVVAFGDAGDVSRDPSFRFDRPQLSAGIGFRWFTLVGALRLDFAYQIPGMQISGGDDDRIVDLDPDGLPVDRGGPFLFHLTIGESF